MRPDVAFRTQAWLSQPSKVLFIFFPRHDAFQTRREVVLVSCLKVAFAHLKIVLKLIIRNNSGSAFSSLPHIVTMAVLLITYGKMIY